MVNFTTWTFDGDFRSHALQDLLLSSDASIYSTVAFSPLGNSDHVIVSVSIGFPLSTKGDTAFHSATFEYPHADWNGLRDHFYHVLLLLELHFLSDLWLELMHTLLIVRITSSFLPLHDFWLLLLLPKFIEIISFVFTNRENLLHLK